MTDIPIAEVDLGEDEIEAAVEVLESGYLRQGERTLEFEEQFADYVGADHAVAVSSGTAALHVAYLALIEEGDDVLVPALSHVSTASMAVFAGASPVFCDVDRETFTLDVESASEKITEDTTAVAPVHLFGNGCDVEAIRRFADDQGLDVLWDAAQAHGTKYGGEDVGGFDDVATYSFYPTKNMTTCEGGMLTTNDPKLAEEFRLLRSHWQTEKYLHPDVGLNYRMTDVEAAIGIQQLDKLDDFNRKRRRNARLLTDGLESVEGVKPPVVSEGVDHSFHQYTVTLDTEVLGYERDEFASELNDHDVGTGVHYPRPLHHQPAFGSTAELPVGEEVCRKVLSLPVHPNLTENQVQRIIETVYEVAREKA